MYVKLYMRVRSVSTLLSSSETVNEHGENMRRVMVSTLLSSSETVFMDMPYEGVRVFPHY